MSSDIANVRADIKAWERKFKETNGREPTIDDIKKQPAVAQKYKLYKKLSKAAAATSSSASRPNDPPSTPRRQTASASKPSPNLLRSNSRLVETTAPLTGFNPFSPQKKSKGKEKEVISEPTANPFASPRKSKTQSPQRQSPLDTFLPIESAQLPHEPVSAISRARKRLRGEPVSPSPNKEKRRRVLSPASLPFPRLQLHASGSDASGDEGNEDFDANASSFVDDSPMKPPVTGKAFTYLFEEVVKPTQSTDLFGNVVLAANTQPSDKRQRSKLFNMGEDVFSDNSEAKKAIHKLSRNVCPSVKGRKPSPQENRMPTKRVLSELERGQNDMATDNPNEKPSSDQPISAPQLLPPSPNSHASRPPGRSKPNGSRSSQPSEVTRRKKAKLQDGDHAMIEDMEENGSSSSDSFSAHHSVKLVHHSRGIRTALPTEEVNSDIEDLVLNYAKRVQPRVQGLVSPMKQSDDGFVNATSGDENEGGNTSGDEKRDGILPNKLRRMLLLESLKSRQNEYEEEKIVRGLLSGRRVLHYDSGKGGEIWGVGEDSKDEFAEDEGQRIDEGLDDWEGDPVPWEVGELSESRYHVEEL